MESLQSIIIELFLGKKKCLLDLGFSMEAAPGVTIAAVALAPSRAPACLELEGKPCYWSGILFICLSSC